MKKLITILLATFLICTASYGATIKELLKRENSIKLICEIEEVEVLNKKTNTFESNTARVGAKRTVVINKSNFVFTSPSGYESALCCPNLNEDAKKDGSTRTNDLVITENQIKAESRYKHGSSSMVRNKHFIINRLTGEFIFNDMQKGGDLSFFFKEKGSCEKATEQKF